MGLLSSIYDILNSSDSTVQNSEELKHSKSYTRLLDEYTNSVKINNKLKKWFKILFFSVTMGILVAVVVIFAISIKYACEKYNSLNVVNIESVASVATIILPSISSLIIAFIKLPEIIAKYLFNIREDQYMNSVIKNIQNYDKSMFALNKNASESAVIHKTEMSNDEDVEMSPREVTI